MIKQLKQKLNDLDSDIRDMVRADKINNIME